MRNILTLAVFIASLITSTSDIKADGLRAVGNKSGKWGYEDATGNLVIKHEFNGASEFDEGVAHVLCGKKYGLINESGQYLLKPEYDLIAPFNSFGLAQVTKGKKTGFVSRQGIIVIPVQYDFAGDFNSEGIVWVNAGGRIKKDATDVTGGKFSLLRSDGSNLLDAEYAKVGTFAPYTYTYTEAQKEKMSATERQLTEGARYHYWRRVSYGFRPGQPIRLSSLGLWASHNADGTYNAVFDTDGKVVVKADKFKYVNRPSEGISSVVLDDGRYNFLDVATGSLLFAETIEDAWAFHNGYCVGTRRNLQYVFDKVGKQCSAGYTRIYPANDGVHVVRNGSDKYGLIRESGEVILSPENYSVYPFVGGASWVKPSSRSKAGYVGCDGRWIIPAAYDRGEPFDGDYAIVSSGGKWGLVDKANEVVIPFEYQSIIKGDGRRKLFWTKEAEGEKYTLYDVACHATLPNTAFTQVTPFDKFCQGIALVNPGKGKETWGWIDKEGMVVIPASYPYPLALKAGSEYINSGMTPWDEYRAMMFRLRNESKPVGLDTKVLEERWDF